MSAVRELNNGGAAGLRFSGRGDKCHNIRVRAFINNSGSRAPPHGWTGRRRRLFVEPIIATIRGRLSRHFSNIEWTRDVRFAKAYVVATARNIKLEIAGVKV